MQAFHRFDKTATGHAPMLAALRVLCDETQEQGRVNFAYETRVYAGRPLR
ncbi:hypothetical protein [Paraburkholderia ferrariae]|nr:hypothetical protein [Paraburkholderia ferrariae]